MERKEIKKRIVECFGGETFHSTDDDITDLVVKAVDGSNFNVENILELVENVITLVRNEYGD